MNNFDCHCIVEVDDPAFSKFYEILEKAFPRQKRRAIKDWNAAARDSRSQVRVYYDENNDAAAIICAWNLNCGRYVEYFAVREDLRGKGIGTSIFKNFIEESTKKVILEIEPLCNEQNTKRWEFYKALGFSKNPGLHAHPPYFRGGARTELLVLNLGPKPLCAGTREIFERELSRDVMCYSLAE